MIWRDFSQIVGLKLKDRSKEILVQNAFSCIQNIKKHFSSNHAPCNAKIQG